MSLSGSRRSTGLLVGASLLLLGLTVNVSAQRSENTGGQEPERISDAALREFARKLQKEREERLKTELQEEEHQLNEELEEKYRPLLIERLRQLPNTYRRTPNAAPTRDPEAERKEKVRLEEERAAELKALLEKKREELAAQFEREDERKLEEARQNLQQRRPPAREVRWTPDRGLLKQLSAFSNPKVLQPETVLTGRWGDRIGQFGKLEAAESNPEAPMSLHVTREKEILVLDQANRRIQRFGPDGSFLRSYPIGSATAQDVTTGPDGSILVLDRFGEPAVQVFSRDGARKARVRVVGKGLVREGGGVSALMADPSGIYVEWAHDDLVAVADADGSEGRPGQTVPGRPMFGGRLFVKAGIIDRKAGELYIQAHRRTGDRDQPFELAWERTLDLHVPVLHLLMIESDVEGHILLGVEVTDDGVEHLATVVVRVNRSGESEGSIGVLPPTTSGPYENFRPLSVSPDGTIYQMTSEAGGVSV